MAGGLDFACGDEPGEPCSDHDDAHRCVSRLRQRPRGTLGTADEVDHHRVERGRVLDHEAVRGARDHHQLRLRNSLGNFFAVAAWREDVLVSDDHQGWRGDAPQLGDERVIGARIASTCALNPCDGLNVANGPSQPMAGASRRKERGPTNQRALSSAH